MKNSPKTIKLKRLMDSEIKKELELLKKMKKYPELFRRCGEVPCCQAKTAKGETCSRPSLTDKTYFKKFQCCYFCWQHALQAGVYVLFTVAKNISSKDMTYDEYYAHYPEECEKMLIKQEKY